jgi:hypothetical protein
VILAIMRAATGREQRGRASTTQGREPFYP